MKNNPLDKIETLEETAAYICEKLKEKHIDVVLSGGSCHVGTLTLLTPTDCIKDRLYALVYHGGEECFNQAVAVAHLNTFDEKHLLNWAKSENKEMLEKVNVLLEDLRYLQKINISNDEIKKYLESKAKNLYLDINKKNDFEDLKDDYVLRQILNIKEDKEYYPIMDNFFEEAIPYECL